MHLAYNSPFIFIVCQVGAESALKQEMQRDYPTLRFAYSRPGFMTFKEANGTFFAPDFSLKAVFARAYGLSLARFSDGAADKIRQLAHALSLQLHAPLHLHVFERDQYAPGEEPKGFVQGCQAERMREILHRETCFAHSQLKNGDFVLDVVWVDADEWWVGLHQHSDMHAAYAGGRPDILLPDEAPSRAYLKLEEALLWSHAPLQAGDTAVEIGSAPGGASYALLLRGLHVVGVDPGKMDAHVEKHSRYTHIFNSVVNVERANLPSRVEWLLCDMNVTPQATLDAVRRLIGYYPSTLKGILITVKLNHWNKAKEIPGFVRQITSMGMTDVRVKQLAYNRQEICIYARAISTKTKAVST